MNRKRREEKREIWEGEGKPETMVFKYCIIDRLIKARTWNDLGRSPIGSNPGRRGNSLFPIGNKGGLDGFLGDHSAAAAQKAGQKTETKTKLTTVTGYIPRADDDNTLILASFCCWLIFDSPTKLTPELLPLALL